MSALRFILNEARTELRAAARGPLIPMIFLGLVGYVAIVVLNAEYMREMGGADVVRNSAHVVQLMTIGTSFWLLFAWAWLFSRAVTRDLDARLHEVVLAAPVSLTHLFIGRYLGALGVGLILGLATPLGFLVVHPLQWVGALPAHLVGPPPWAAMAWGWLVFTVTSGVGMGALYLAVAIRTRGSAGAFGLAALVVSAWMFSMVILRGGDINPTIATLLDPTGFGEAEVQSNSWTPAEKVTSLVELTPVLLLNRLLWGALPGLPLLFVLGRLRREDLVLERGGTPKVESEGPVRIGSTRPSLGPVATPSWLWATVQEAHWHLGRSLRSWSIWLAMGLLCLMCILGSFVHVVAHAEGPLVPRPNLLVPMLAEFLFLTIAFVIAGFVGAMMRRDEEVGFYEIVGAAPAPFVVRLGGRAIAAAGLTISMMIVPIVACYVVTGIGAPSSFAFGTPPLYFLLVYAPALLELGALTVLCHALFKSSSVAYSVSVFLTFILVVNHELSLVTYPLAEIGLPGHVRLSALVGWAPWLPLAGSQALFKLGVVLLLTGVAWLWWSRGYVDHWTDRWREAARRLRGGASVTVASGLVIMAGSAAVAYDGLVVRGDYETKATKDAARAAWEKRWLEAPPRFEVEGGEVDASVDPSQRTAEAWWVLRGVRSPERALRAELPSGVAVTEARVEGQAVEAEVEAETLGLALGPCATAAEGCRVELAVRAERTGWPLEDAVPWVSARQFVLTAEDLLPRLGIDPHRALRSPLDRQSLGLPATPPEVPRGAEVSARGVAPPGRWRWRVEAPEGWSLAKTGTTAGPLDFAVVWQKEAPATTTREGLRAVHGPMHLTTAEQVLEDLEAMTTCVGARLGVALPRIEEVVQAPRHREVGVFGSVLVLAEDPSWDVAESGYGRWHRREIIARAVAAEVLSRRSGARSTPGSRWLLEGIPGWLGLSCVRELDGDDAWRALVDRASVRVVEALGALSAPIRGLGLDGDAEWVEPYAGLSTFAWAQMLGEDRAAEAALSVADKIARGAPVRVALEAVTGEETSRMLLGPPLASDAAVARDGASGRDAASARRWTWAAGGWQTGAPAERLLVLAPYRLEPSTRRFLTPPSVIESDEPVTVYDAWPSFERSILDNVWAPKGER